MQNKSLVRIGTRGSQLALAQASEVKARLAAAHEALRDPDAVEIVVISTTGDRVQDRPLADIGGKGLFTKEIEEALLSGGIDLAVHSMKDVPTVLPDGLIIDCILEREDPRDAFLSTKAAGIDELPAGSVVGTSSLRRQALILSRRPDLKVVSFRGNVGTRLRKLDQGDVDATLLAMAGLNRLALQPAGTAPIPADVMLPAVAQGAIGIERRQADDRIAGLLAPLNHADSAIRVTAERALLAELDGSCRTPIAAHAVLAGGKLSLRGLVVLPDGTQRHDTALDGAPGDAAALGREVGLQLKRDAGAEFFRLLGQG
ncbi:MAG: hydroxymethylbilane synthase [Oceanibaculum nanhaiense]|uniref:hydroxymethylbilane synthase n=1 Tax=Oceanibaculum nanhaiense TaxID=1909734 RepID=UPI0025A35ABE|nr:hydroxymethylbilane synthase [Oceanibaculum nanhaiense]MDM7944856.1 hydroxymethylbilane synthase [Oceanibaculum nanhaiense]